MSASPRSITTLAGALLLALACRGEPTAPSSPDMSGPVLEVRATNARAAGTELLVDVALSDHDPGERITYVVHVDPRVPIYRIERDQQYRPATLAGIVPGDIVEVWTTGVEWRSLPPQVEARRIVVVGRID